MGAALTSIPVYPEVLLLLEKVQGHSMQFLLLMILMCTQELVGQQTPVVGLRRRRATARRSCCMQELTILPGYGQRANLVRRRPEANLLMVRFPAVATWMGVVQRIWKESTYWNVSACEEN